MASVRIAHISDLHLSPFHKRANIWKTRQLLEHIRRINVDHIVMTGDIVADANGADFSLARKILSSHDLLDASRLSVVVGNHDVFGGVHTAEEIFEFPRRCRSTDHIRRLEEFREHFQELFDGCSFGSRGSAFPYVKQFDNLLLIGMNSVTAYAMVSNPVGSNGAVEHKQLRDLDRLLSAPRFRHTRRIVLIHHHFNKVRQKVDGTMQGVWRAFESQTTKLRGKKELARFFRKHDVAAVLHGHSHENLEYTRKGIRFFNAGGSILGPDPGILRLNLLTIDNAGVTPQRIIIRTPDTDRHGRIVRATLGATATHIAA